MKTKNLQTSLLSAAVVAALACTAGNLAAQDSTTAAGASAAAATPLTYGVPQVLQLSQAKVSDSIIVNYIQNSGTIYALDAGQIVYLKQQGLSDAVLNAMLNQRSRLTGSTEPATTTAATTATAPEAPAPPPATYVQSASASTVYVIPDTQTYGYYDRYYGGYPYYSYYPYSYGYYGWPAVSLSFGWGGGWHGGGGWHSSGGWHGGGGWHSSGGWHGSGGWHH